MKKLRFQISGMHCDNCTASIRIVLGDINGVATVDVRLHEADVNYDESNCNVETIIEAIRSAGPFDVTGFQSIEE